MNVLLAFILYKNLSFGDILRLRPYLPADTRRGLAAVEAYEKADSTPPVRDIDALAEAFEGNSFTFLLLKLLNMRNRPHKDGDVFSLLKCLIPADVAANIPDPQMLMSMIELFKSMNFESESSEQGDCEETACNHPASSDQNKRNENQLSDGQLSFLKNLIYK